VDGDININIDIDIDIDSDRETVTGAEIITETEKGTDSYGVATISRLLKIIGLFCRISSLL